MKKYNVALSNNSCIFDSCDGFCSVAEAISWASDRGGEYVIQIAKEVDGKEVDFLSIGASTSCGRTTYSHYYICDWEPVTVEQIARMI
jgi:hypothetical protein